MPYTLCLMPYDISADMELLDCERESIHMVLSLLASLARTYKYWRTRRCKSMLCLCVCTEDALCLMPYASCLMPYALCLLQKRTRNMLCVCVYTEDGDFMGVVQVSSREV